MMAKKEMKVGLALGGGGARGLIHVPVLELFDEMGIRPHRITGTSMGAIMGALYAAGRSGQGIRATIDNIRIKKDDTFEDVVRKRKDLMIWLDAVAPDFGRGGFLKLDRFMEYLYDHLKRTTFEDLDIPLRVVASDYWNRKEVVFKSGKLIPAIRASIAIPGVFAPVKHDDHVLVDGGLSNPLPYDLLMDECDIVVAIDAMGVESVGKRKIPHTYESILNSFYIAQQAIQSEKMKHAKPHIYIKPDIKDVGILEFYKMDDVYEQAKSSIRKLKRELGKLI
jgi:NTE family protein